MSFFSVSVNTFLLKPSGVVGMFILVTPYIQLYLVGPITIWLGKWESDGFQIPIAHSLFRFLLTTKRDVSCFPSLKHVLPKSLRFPKVAEVAEVAVTPAPELVEVGCGGVSLSGLCHLTGPTGPARRWWCRPGEFWTLWMTEISDCCMMILDRWNMMKILGQKKKAEKCVREALRLWYAAF